jgi:Protein of unknown function (DUF2752)
VHIALVPRPLMHKLCISDPDAIHLNVLVSCALLAGLFAWPDALNVITSLPHFCLFEYAFHIPCPGCDMTAALAACAHLDFHRSLMIQPCAIAFALTLFVQSAIRGAYLLRIIELRTANQGVKKLASIFITMLMAFWLIRLIQL